MSVPSWKNIEVLLEKGSIIAMGRSLFSIFILIAAFNCLSFSLEVSEDKIPVRIGYFLGGRTALFYRAYLNHDFDKEGVNVILCTKAIGDERIFDMPKNHEEVKELYYGMIKNYGRVEGTRIIADMVKNKLQGGTVGESSFVLAVAQGAPIVAVAMLGHDGITHPGKAIIVRHGSGIKRPEDFKGKTLVSRRAGPGDAIFLKEFVRHLGLDPGKDVKIIEQVDDKETLRLLKQKKIDGGLYHVRHVYVIIERDKSGYVYETMDKWMNPAISQSVLAFRKDFVAQHPEIVEKIIKTYMKRIVSEGKISQEQKLAYARNYNMETHREDLMTQRSLWYEDMDLPECDYPPYLQLDQLNEIQGLLLKYNYIQRKIDLSPFVNNFWVKKIADELKSNPK